MAYSSGGDARAEGPWRSDDRWAQLEHRQQPRRPERWASQRQQQLPHRPGAGRWSKDQPSSGIPEDYRAAGVIFYTRDAEKVSHVLLGVERRKVRLQEMDMGHGTEERDVVVFPQGKREPQTKAQLARSGATQASGIVDRNHFDTARREFVEETGDTWGLARLLEPAAEGEAEEPPLARYFPFAKMAVVHCEVPTDGCGGEPPPLHAADGPEGAAAGKDLRMVWVPSSQLCGALRGRPSALLETSIGDFPIFSMTREYFSQPCVMSWLSS